MYVDGYVCEIYICIHLPVILVSDYINRRLKPFGRHEDICLNKLYKLLAPSTMDLWRFWATCVHGWLSDNMQARRERERTNLCRDLNRYAVH